MSEQSDLMKNRKEELEEKWLTMCNKAQYYRGVSDTGNHVVPDWFDPVKFEEAQRFLKNDMMG